MRIIKLKELEKFKAEIKKDLKDKIFIYPTDTIYGLGCSVEGPVEDLYKIKKRDKEKPFSVIVPSKDWIYQNCVVSTLNKSFIEQLLPGPYTIVLKYKTVPKCLENREKTIGVRVFNSPFTKLLKEENLLFITTSVNISEEQHVKSIQEIPEEIKQSVTWAIDAGELGGKPSRVFDLTSDDIKVLRP